MHAHPVKSLEGDTHSFVSLGGKTEESLKNSFVSEEPGQLC